MSQNGVYAWIREGVRRAVLLGVSDAIEQLGVPGENEQLNQHLAGTLKPLRGPEAKAAIAAPAKTERRRLGRSLDQIVREPEHEE